MLLLLQMQVVLTQEGLESALNFMLQCVTGVPLKAAIRLWIAVINHILVSRAAHVQETHISFERWQESDKGSITSTSANDQSMVTFCACEHLVETHGFGHGKLNITVPYTAAVQV